MATGAMPAASGTSHRVEVKDRTYIVAFTSLPVAPLNPSRVGAGPRAGQSRAEQGRQGRQGRARQQGVPASSREGLGGATLIK